jgi:hypothetical protein
MASSGKAARMVAVMAASASRSARVTGDPSALLSKPIPGLA